MKLEGEANGAESPPPATGGMWYLLLVKIFEVAAAGNRVMRSEGWCLLLRNRVSMKREGESRSAAPRSTTSAAQSQRDAAAEASPIGDKRACDGASSGGEAHRQLSSARTAAQSPPPGSLRSPERWRWIPKRKKSYIYHIARSPAGEHTWRSRAHLDHASHTYYTFFPFPAPRARLCKSAVGGVGRTRAVHRFRSEGRCAVVLLDLGVERL